MGKMKSFLINCIDNHTDPVYTLNQVSQYRIKNEKVTKETKPNSKGSAHKSLVQEPKGSKS